MTFINFEKMAALFLKYWDKYLIDGVGYTLALSAITVAGGVVFASLLALMKMSRIAPLRWISSVYIEIIRGTPMLLQFYFFYFGLPMLIPALNKQKFVCIAIALICNSAAYVSEVIRSGIGAVPGGQMEAARCIGMSHWKAMRHVILPQAVRNILPAMCNEFVTIIKETSILGMVGIVELMFHAQSIAKQTYIFLEPYVIAAIMYFIIVFPLSKIIAAVERRMSKSVTR